jgi:UDP-2-acetamido-2,6-beta-L-arabino-hexul-4-ose reductase
MIQVGITGQSGFIGTHLYSSLSRETTICCIPFKDEYFDDDLQLDFFTSKCDIIIHLASVHRNPEPEKIYNANLSLTRQLLNSCNRTKRCNHIIFTSSIQENNGSAYGRSKKYSRLMIEEWACSTGKSATTLTLPNIFGPGAKPFHTSFIATFSFQLWHKEEPRILEDREIPLTFIYDLLDYFHQIVMRDRSNETIHIPVARIIKVSEILHLLKIYRDSSEANTNPPVIMDEFNRNLLKTFYSYMHCS